MSKKLNIGLIGAGRIGQVHAEHLAFRIPEANLLMVTDVNRAAAESCAERFSIPEVAESYEAILNDPRIDAVVICSSTDTHARIMEEAAQAGKHIFCEKPIDHSLSKIDRALAAVKKAGVKLQIGFNRRFDPNFRAVREAIQEGRIGDLNILHIISRDPSPPPIEYVKVSGGMFLDMTIHDFDMARYLVDSEVDSIYAVGGVKVDPAIGKAGDIDTAVITLTFKNGVIATIDNCRQAVYGYDQRVEAFGSEGVISTENITANRTVVGNRSGFASPLPLNFFMDRYTESYIAEMREFIDSVLNDRTPPVTGNDGRIPILMGLAAKRSLEEKRPVTLAEVEEAALA